MRHLLQARRFNFVLSIALSVVLIFVGPVRAQNSLNSENYTRVVERADLAMVTKLVERQGFSVRPVTGKVGTSYAGLRSINDELSEAVLLFGFIQFDQNISRLADSGPILRLASLDYAKYSNRAAEIAAGATLERLNKFNTIKTGSPFLFWNPADQGVFLRSDIDLTSGVTLARVNYHFAEFAGYIGSAENYLAGSATQASFEPIVESDPLAMRKIINNTVGNWPKADELNADMTAGVVLAISDK